MKRADDWLELENGLGDGIGMTRAEMSEIAWALERCQGFDPFSATGRMAWLLRQTAEKGEGIRIRRGRA